MSDEESAILSKVNVRRLPCVMFPREFRPGEMRTLVVLLCGWQVLWYQRPILWGVKLKRNIKTLPCLPREQTTLVHIRLQTRQ